MVAALKSQKPLPGSGITNATTGEENKQFTSPSTLKRKSLEVRLLSAWTRYITVCITIECGQNYCHLMLVTHIRWLFPIIEL